MPTFDFTNLLWWGLPLAAVPVVIHLINLLRHRTIDWAAMEFLLASQRKYRTRIFLKQLLLLLLRILAILGLVAVLAQPRWTTDLGLLLGGQQTTHVVLLDDSFSMAETLPDSAPKNNTQTTSTQTTSPFIRGRRLIARLLEELAATPGQQLFSLGRFSQFSSDRPPDRNGPDELTDQFDLREETVSPQNLTVLRRTVEGLAHSAHAVGPMAAIRSAIPLFSKGEGGVLWLITDLRSRDWLKAEPTAEILQPLADAGIEIHFVDAAALATEQPATDAEPRANLTVERLEMVGGVPATDVLLPWEVTLRNQGDMPAGPVALAIREDGLERPGLQVDGIPAGETVNVRFESRFPEAGGHLVEVELPTDQLAVDNIRTAGVFVVDEAEVLIIAEPTGSEADAGSDAFYLATALDPGAAAATGLSPRIESPRALAQLDLSRFDSIWLVDVARLDAAEREPLEAYAKAGGGVVFFMGPDTSAAEINDTLFREGAGLFPAPLAGPVDLLPDPRNPEAPDVVAENHPVVAVLSGRRNPFLDAVRVERYMAIKRDYEPPPESGLRRLLSLRNRAALALERPFGSGLGVAILTTAGPVWNNWARNNPSWVVVMLELEGQLARLRRQRETLLVGEPLEVVLEQGVDQIDVDFLLPPHGTTVRQVASTSADGELVAQLSDTNSPGGYLARWQTVSGGQRERVIAVNVNPTEGNLERIAKTDLDQVMAGIPFLYERAELLEPGDGNRSGTSLLRPLLLLLLCILLAEQALGFIVSYHPVRRSTR
ncbi:MAG: hypothetical protein EBU59_01435 [Planctomycetia bacterium]|nr:hypothetical protein [Planctomycetia bacterium]